MDGIVPILPLRLNFILNCEDFFNRIESFPGPFTVIDLGCGPYAIISQLVKKLNGWKSICVEQSDISKNLAKVNLKKSGLDGITFMEADKGNILPSFKVATGQKRPAPTDYVIICNPPWFKKGFHF